MLQRSHGARHARHRVPALGQGPDQGTADGGVVFHQQQLCHTSEGSCTVPLPQVDPVSGDLFPSLAAGFLRRSLPALKAASATLGSANAHLSGVGAWLLGAGAATAGSLLAVSLLGQGIAASPSQQLTAAAVNQALARQSRGPRRAARRGPSRPSHVSHGPARRDPHHGEPARPGSPAPSPRPRLRRRPPRRARRPRRAPCHLAGRHRAGRVPVGRYMPGVLESHPGLRAPRHVTGGRPPRRRRRRIPGEVGRGCTVTWRGRPRRAADPSRSSPVVGLAAGLACDIS